MTTKRFACSSFIAWLLLLGCSESAAEESSHTFAHQQARLLFERGMEAAERGNVERAIESFEQSYELYPTWRSLANLYSLLNQASRREEAYHRCRELLDEFGQDIPPEIGQQAQATMDSLMPRLTVTTDPEDAHVWIDGEPISQTPLENEIILEPGRHEVEVRLESYRSASETVDIPAGETQDIHLTLEREEPPSPPPRSMLSVRTNVDGARVTVDDEPRGTAPLELELAPGEHWVRAVAEECDPEEQRVTLPDTGERRSVTFELNCIPDSEPNGRRRHIWLWIVGTAVVLGTTATVLGVTLRNDEPDFDYIMRVR